MPVTTPLTRITRFSSGWRLHAASRHTCSMNPGLHRLAIMGEGLLTASDYFLPFKAGLPKSGSAISFNG
ncbi:hypothetical protein ABF80_09480 [Enterobacter hormaechei subsp. steigerwaltii]|nr:hypothetical protein SR88_13490 [Enterobacter hormaechei subsp. steigerwaltii]KYJ81929.1 hypothetical protein AT292_00785 [Enterobacter cloacae]KZP95803.1 hypothetical protein A3N46_20220 [Enterobacter asburiae]MDI4537297.1 hypothetical protein [Escherichia coli]RTQ14082.1 hypothetical protein EKN27_16830 [Enterobacter hormaechei]